jgi:hypothetical protein
MSPIATSSAGAGNRNEPSLDAATPEAAPGVGLGGAPFTALVDGVGTLDAATGTAPGVVTARVEGAGATLDGVATDRDAGSGTES